MATAYSPYRYRRDDEEDQFVSPGVLTPQEDSPNPAFDPSQGLSDDNQNPSPMPPRPPRAPKPFRLNDTQAGASLQNLPPLDPSAVKPSGNYSGLRLLAKNEPDEVMPPPGTPAVMPPPSEEARAPVQGPVIPQTPDVESAVPTPAAKPSSDTAQKLADVAAKLEAKKNDPNRPPASAPNNWAQRLAMALLAMTKLAPAANEIVHPKWSQQMHDYQSSVGNLEGQQKDIEGQLAGESQAEQRDAAAEQKRGLAQSYDIRAENQAQAIKDKIAALTSERNRKFIEDRLKGRQQDSSYQSETDPIPPGYEFIKDPEHPGFGFAAPPAWREAPSALLPFLAGAKEGDQVSHSEFKAAQDALNKQQLEQTKADNRPDKVPPITNDLLSIRAEGKGTGNSTIDAMTPAEAASALKRSRTNPNIQVFTGTADSEPGSLAHMVAEYQTPWSTAIARMPAAQRDAFAGQVRQLNPDFQASNYDTYKSTEHDATTGKIATNANALNTMMGHLSVLDKAADALKNNDIQLLNRIANQFSVQTGQTPVTTYQAIVHRLGPEITKAYVAAGGTQGERGTNEEDFAAHMGPNQIKQNIGISAYLADSKIKALQDQYKRGTYGRGKQKLISDEAEAARQALAARVGGGGKTVNMRSPGPNGKVQAVPADQVEHFKSKGATVVQ